MYVPPPWTSALVPPGVVTVTRYVVPSITGGVVAVIAVVPWTVTLAAGSTTLSLAGLDPVASTKLTVDPGVKPVPVIVTVVPPADVPLAGDTPTTVGTTGDHSQLSITIRSPQ